MNTVTGQVYADLATARADATNPSDVVMVHGDPVAVARLSRAVVAQRRSANKRARASRKRNRRP